MNETEGRQGQTPPGDAAAPPPPPPPLWQPPGAPAPDPLVQELSWPLYRARGWLQFLGVMSILSGVITALTLFGIIIAWLPIWMGALMFQAAERLEAARRAGSRLDFAKATDRLRLVIMIQGITSLASLALSAIVVMTIGMAGIAGLLAKLD